jgi:hypothetical protein
MHGRIIAAMNVLFAFLIMAAPFALAALLTWATHRDDSARRSLLADFDDRDGYRMQHDIDATRTRFEGSPRWPASGVMGERR